MNRTRNVLLEALEDVRCYACGEPGLLYEGYARVQKDGSYHVTAACNHCFVRGPRLSVVLEFTGEFTEEVDVYGRYNLIPWLRKKVVRREPVYRAYVKAL